VPKTRASRAKVLVNRRAKRYLIAAVAMSPDVWEEVPSVNSVEFVDSISGESVVLLSEIGVSSFMTRIKNLCCDQRYKQS